MNNDNNNEVMNDNEMKKIIMKEIIIMKWWKWWKWKMKW